jgi:hypothetical protein
MCDEYNFRYISTHPIDHHDNLNRNKEMHDELEYEKTILFPSLTNRSHSQIRAIDNTGFDFFKIYS